MLNKKDMSKLLAYAAVVNGYIHSEQLIYINKIVKYDKEMYKEVYEILLSDETYDHNLSNDFKMFVRNMSEQLTYESRWKQKCLNRKMLKLMCYDGSFDKKERELMADLFPKMQYSERTLLWHTSHFKQRTCGNAFSRFIEKIKSKIFNTAVPFYGPQQLRFDEFVDKVVKENHDAINQALSTIAPYYQISVSFDEYRDQLHSINKSEATVSLVGKTKSGKSTLFSLLSGTGKELIGRKGIQRTSKCVVVTHYKGIKVVDTPGLAAANKKGDNDEKIAENACKDADNILFLMPNDTYNDELKFIKNLVYMNKPISVLFNYKNADWFEYYFDELLSDPEIWQKGDGDNCLSGWANPLLRYSSEYGFKSVLENRIYYSFLLAAEIGKNRKIGSSGIHIKKLSLAKRRKIYEASNFEKYMSVFFEDYVNKAKLLRLSRLADVSIKYVDDVKSDIEELLIANEKELENISKELEDSSKAIEKINSILDEFENSCIDDAKTEIKNILTISVFSDSGVDFNARNQNDNKEFEMYVKELFERISKEISFKLNSIISEKIDNINDSLSCYDIICKNNFAVDNSALYVMKEKFKTSENINPLKTKELYILPKIGLGIASVIPSPFALVFAALGIGLDYVLDKKTSSRSELVDQRSVKRSEEIVVLFDEMAKHYIDAVEIYVHNISKRIRQCRKIKNYEKEIQDCQTRTDKLENVIRCLDNSEDITLRNYSIELLKICQKEAIFKRYSIKRSNSGFPALCIYAKNCREECFDDMRYVIHIKKEG